MVSAVRPLRGSRIGELSGGEQRILECFVILRSRTQFILLDEPFSQIAPLHVETLQTLIRQEKMAKESCSPTTCTAT